jgi:predicted ATP-grasp superfamily ATP-dependent carboligase
MVSVALEDVAPAAAALTRLLDRINYRGVFSAEFKRDPRDNQFKILEVNARPWWYVEFAAHCGLDVCKMSYRDALRMPVQTCEQYQVGRRCMMLAIDLLAFYAMRKKPESLRLSEWLESLRDADDALFSSRDPLPALAHWGRLLKQRILPAATYSAAVSQLRVPPRAVENTASETLAEAGPVRRG